MEGCRAWVGGETSEGMCVGHCVGVYGKGSQEGRAPQEKSGENCATVSCACCHVGFFFCVPSVDCFLLVEEFLTFFLLFFFSSKLLKVGESIYVQCDGKSFARHVRRG